MKKTDVKCVLCGEYADPESPYIDGAIHGRNPNTFRMAWMHHDCLTDALDVLKQENIDKYDKYILGE